MLRSKLGVRRSCFPAAVGALFAYLFRRIDQKEMLEHMDDLGGAALRESSLELVRHDGDLLKNYKLYAWAYFRYRNGKQAKPRPRDYGVAPADVRILSRLNLNHLDLDYESLTVEEFDAKCQEVLLSQKMRDHIGKYISKSLLFLIKHYGVDRLDIEGAMKAAALKTVYLKYPAFETDLHFENSMKTAIHNEGQTLVNYHTAPSRQRLQRRADGSFESRHVEYAALGEHHAPESYLQSVKEDLEELVRVCLDGNMRADVQRFLMCCAGHRDEGFSEFLGVDNTVAVESMAYSRYMKRAQRYFQFTDRQVSGLFTKLKAHLST